ncbi:MAG: hypothetical protein P4L73_15985 [Caulobacteraceae bacterium]|nr:hypothetical protein [Caulobacteraceae bacterium]
MSLVRITLMAGALASALAAPWSKGGEGLGHARAQAAAGGLARVAKAGAGAPDHPRAYRSPQDRPARFSSVRS